MKSFKLIAVLSSVATGLICGTVGYGISYFVTKPTSDEQKLIDEYNVLKDEWLFLTDDVNLSDAAANGLVSGVASKKSDNYTFYTESVQEQGLSTDGNGFGFLSHFYDGGLYVVEVYTESTSYKAGLREKDVIYSIKVGSEDIFNFQNHTLSEINSKLSSVNDTTTTFEFQIKRGGEDISLSMKRGAYSQNMIDIIQTPSTENNQTMTIKVNTFLGQPALALEGALSSYSSNINKLVLDLRGNGGGYVSQAEAMAKLFVKKGTMIYQLKDRNDNVIEASYQKSDPKFTISNYSIIMDNNTASASEIFALAMRAGTNTTTYGLTSYGKGIAQKFKYFSDGSVMRYTYAYVYGPEKENENIEGENEDDDDIVCIHNKGITPDIPYSIDYTYLGTNLDLSSTGISTYMQDYFLKILKEIHPDEFANKAYLATYHYIDAITDYYDVINNNTDETNLGISGFNESGGMNKRLNDILNKEEYDKYCYYYNDLTFKVSK